jgi:hypothetical protein
MDSLCARARAAMNLLLLAVVLQSWVMLTDRPVLSDKTQYGILSLAYMPAAAMSGDLSLIYVGINKEPKPPEITDSVLCGEIAKTTNKESPLEHVQLVAIANLSYDNLNSIRSQHGFHAFATAIQEIRDAISPQTTKSQSLCDLLRDNNVKLSVPFVNQSVRERYALWTIAVAALAALLLLWSLSASMLQVLGLQSKRDEELRDWLPIHPGSVAACIGVLWLYAAGILDVFALFSKHGHWRIPPRDDGAQVAITAATLVVIYFVHVRVLKIRKSLYP